MKSMDFSATIKHLLNELVRPASSLFSQTDRGKEDKENYDKMQEEVNSSYNPENVLGVNSGSSGGSSSIDIPEFEKLVPEVSTDEEIRKKAEDYLAEFAEKQKTAIEEAAVKGTEDLNEYKAAQTQNKKAQEEEIARQHEIMAESTQSAALKRGLARSSIIMTQLAAVDKNKADKLIGLNENYLQEISKADYELNKLQTQKETALKNLDATKATALAMKIEELTKTRDEKIAEAIKYNNSLEEKLADFKLDMAKTESDIRNKDMDTEGKKYDIIQGSAYQKATELKRYESIKGYLMTLEPEQAFRELQENSYYEANLTNYYYSKLLTELRDRR